MIRPSAAPQYVRPLKFIIEEIGRSQIFIFFLFSITNTSENQGMLIETSSTLARIFVNSTILFLKLSRQSVWLNVLCLLLTIFFTISIQFIFSYYLTVFMQFWHAFRVSEPNLSRKNFKFSNCSSILCKISEDRVCISSFNSRHRSVSSYYGKGIKSRNRRAKSQKVQLCNLESGTFFSAMQLKQKQSISLDIGVQINLWGCY